MTLWIGLLFGRNDGIEGCVEVNGEKQDVRTFRKQSAYITQKDHLLQDLTLEEYMMAAVHLKLGNKVPNKEKLFKVFFSYYALELKKKKAD